MTFENTVRSKLSNNTTILVDSDDRLRTVTFAVCLVGGLADEAQEKVGISHLLEHLLFKRTKSKNTKQLAALMDELGGDINAFTDIDSLCLYGTTPSRHFEKLVQLFAELFFEAAFNEEDLEIEKEIIRQEILEANDSPADVTYQRLNQILWPDSIYQYPVFGSLASLEKYSLADLFQRQSQILQGERCIIAACGGVTADTVQKLSESYFSSLPSSEYIKLPQPTRGTGMGLVKHPSSQVYLTLSQPWVPADSNDVGAGLIISNMLGGGLSSRLFQRLREEEGLVYEISSSVELTAGVSNLLISSVLERDLLPKAVDIIFQEMEGLSSGDFDSTEVERSRQMLLARQDMDMDHAGNRLWYAVDHEIRSRFFVDNTHPNVVREKLLKTTTSDVQRVSVEFLLGLPGAAVFGGDVEQLEVPKQIDNFVRRHLLN